MKGKILFLEEVKEAPHKVYRNILHLEHSGVFDQLSGLILGEFLSCHHPKGVGPSVSDIFKVCFEKYDYPVYRTSAFGHGESIRSFPIGAKSSLSSDGLSIVV